MRSAIAGSDAVATAKEKAAKDLESARGEESVVALGAERLSQEKKARSFTIPQLKDQGEPKPEKDDESEKSSEGSCTRSPSTDSSASSADLAIPYVSTMGARNVVHIESEIENVPICSARAEPIRAPTVRGTGARNMCGVGKAVCKNCLDKSTDAQKRMLSKLW